MRYYEELASAFVRGRLGRADAAISDGVTAGLRLHKFKRESELPRVLKVLGILRGFQPYSLLDIGSGRGAFLWPLLDAFPSLPVTAIDRSGQRASDLGAVRRGGVSRLHVAQMDVARPGFAPGSFDGVTMLEVLEHLAAPAEALRQVLPLARRFLVLSVPSKEDDNPEHLHLFAQADLERMLLAAGAKKVKFDGVLNHRLAVAML